MKTSPLASTLPPPHPAGHVAVWGPEEPLLTERERCDHDVSIWSNCWECDAMIDPWAREAEARKAAGMPPRPDAVDPVAHLHRRAHAKLAPPRRKAGGAS